MRYKMIIDILGSKYTITQSNEVDDPCLKNCSGYCDHSVKKIVIDTFHSDLMSMEDLDEYRKKVIRHELVHAFLFESGLGEDSWGNNEEIVDWIAYQLPKMMEAVKDAKAL
jgi:hypothetical protein